MTLHYLNRIHIYFINSVFYLFIKARDHDFTIDFKVSVFNALII